MQSKGFLSQRDEIGFQLNSYPFEASISTSNATYSHASKGIKYHVAFFHPSLIENMLGYSPNKTPGKLCGVAE